MKLALNTLTLATLAALAPAAHAEIFIDQIGNSEVSFEGLFQADYNYFDSDYAQLGCDGAVSGSLCAPTFNSGDGLDADFAIRRAELILKGKGPGMWNWVLGYDAKDQKFLDTNISYRFSGFTTQASIREQTERLRAWAAAKNLKLSPTAQVARYDDPFTLPWNRRNEILIDLMP